MKYSFLDDSITKLDLGIFRITNLQVSLDNRIEVIGLNENAEAIKGYLNLNDQVSFGDPKSKSVVVLTPMN